MKHERSPRILFVNRFFHPDLSATAQMCTRLALALHDEGFDVETLTSRACYGQPDGVLPVRERFCGITIHRVPSYRWIHGGFLSRLAHAALLTRAVVRFLKRHIARYDMIVPMTDPPLIGVAVARATRSSGAACVQWLQDLYPEIPIAMTNKRYAAAFWRLFIKERDRALIQSAVSITPCQGMAEILTERGVPRKQLAVIPNWSPFDDPAPVTLAADLAKEWGVEGKFVVGYSGNLGLAHDYETLLECAEALREDSSIVFLFTGGGAHRSRLQLACRKKRLTNMVFKPYLAPEMLPAGLAVADIQCISCKPEAERLLYPSKFYGILAAGKPVLFIGDPEGEMSREIRTSQCGVCVRPGDGAAMAGRIREWREDPSSVRRMGGNARRMHERLHSFPARLKNWVELLHRVRAESVRETRDKTRR